MSIFFTNVINNLMNKTINKIILSLTLISLSSFVNASLITNGSFEQVIFADKTSSTGKVYNTDSSAYQDKNSVWDVFYTLPGWETSYGNGMELQKNVVTQSQHGLHHIELDTYNNGSNGSSNAVITQTLTSLIIGEQYSLEFYYKPRTNNQNDNGINVFWYDSTIDYSLDMTAVLQANSTSKSTPDWALQSVLFTADAQSMNLSFGAFGLKNTLGGLIDNVSLKQVTSVPEPPMFILFFMAITLLFISQGKKRRLKK